MTAQMHERLILKGKKTSMACEPDLPRQHPRLIRLPEPLDHENPMNFSTACWRNYIGSWEITDNKLYLNSVEGKYQLLPGKALFADWVTEKLRVPQGKMLNYQHAGFGSTYEKELFLTVPQGVVIETEVIVNK